jgi:cell division septation protein DedD
MHQSSVTDRVQTAVATLVLSDLTLSGADPASPPACSSRRDTRQVEDVPNPGVYSLCDVERSLRASANAVEAQPQRRTDERTFACAEAAAVAAFTPAPVAVRLTRSDGVRHHACRPYEDTRFQDDELTVSRSTAAEQPAGGLALEWRWWLDAS